MLNFEKDILNNKPRQYDWQGRTGGGSYRDGHGGKSTGHNKRRNERVQDESDDTLSKVLRICATCQRSRWPNAFGRE